MLKLKEKLIVQDEAEKVVLQEAAKYFWYVQ